MTNPETQLEDVIIYESYDKLSRQQLYEIYQKATWSAYPFSYYDMLLVVRDLIGNNRTIEAIRNASSFMFFGRINK